MPEIKLFFPGLGREGYPVMYNAAIVCVCVCGVCVVCVCVCVVCVYVCGVSGYVCEVLIHLREDDSAYYNWI